MTERKGLPEKHGVVFALYKDGTIHLEKRLKPDEFQGQVIVPGGGVESDETLEDALLREVKEEFGVEALNYYNLGTFPTTEGGGILNFRHLYLVTDWKGVLSNIEAKSEHLSTTMEKAKEICTHPLAQVFLQVVERKSQILSRQDS